MSSKESKEKLIDDQIDSNLTAVIGISVLSYSEKQIDKKSVIFYKGGLQYAAIYGKSQP